MKSIVCLSVSLLSVWTLSAAELPRITRIFRAPRYVRGNTNVLKVQPIDDATWIWSQAAEKIGTPSFVRFRRAFKVEKAGKCTIDVSADERFYLLLDGAFVARGPNRAIVENWQYQTYEIDLPVGEHVFEAVVWRTGWCAPLAQLSSRGGFILKADGAYDALLTTGKAPWEVGVITNLKPIGASNDVWGTGQEWEMVGTGFYDVQPETYERAINVRGPAGVAGPVTWGLRTGGWLLFPTQIPDQLELSVQPGKIKAVTRQAGFRKNHVYRENETKGADLDALNALLHEGRAFTVPAHTRLQAAWDLGDYYCAYPELIMKNGKGSRVAWCWAESTRRESDDFKGGESQARNLIVDRYLDGYGDVFVSDGRARGVFSSPWLRCGKWCRLDIETGDEPLTLTGLRIIESRYPLSMESAFASPDDPSFDGIRKISLRAMQMCSHEMLFDCPYYEQQMYPGDSRVQLNVLTALAQDDRLIRRAIEIFDLSTRDDGQAPFNAPSRNLQEGATYTLCYLLMHGDYAMNHDNREWLRARLPGLRKSMAGIEYYENNEGLLENMPGWQFMDWVVGWDKDGTVPGGRLGDGVNAEVNLFWVLAMKSAAITERALGHELQAQYWDEKRVRLAQKIVETFWCKERGVLADTPAMKDFSEHAQCLALIGDVLPEDKAKVCFQHLIEDADLKRTTVYFNYYLFECFFKFGRADLFLKRLDLWRTYVDKGLVTTQESPDAVDKDGKPYETRSDCHAWGAHPIWFMQTGLAGIHSDAPFFAKVRVAPCPGSLTSLTAKHPHPKGFIEVDLKFAKGKATGIVKTPVAGTFVFGDQQIQLIAGENRIQ